MKIRILNSSIRLRLTQTEVEELGRGEKIVGEVNFPDGKLWKYILETAKIDDVFEVNLEEAALKICMNQSAAEVFINTDSVGQESELDTKNGPLKILVEKDFKCLTPRSEDESDLFEHPEVKHPNC